MKTKIIYLLIFTCIKIFAQFDMHCVTDHNNVQSQNIQSRNDDVKSKGSYNVAVCYINFADGFLPNGSIPLSDNDLNNVNIESVCRVGYKRVGSVLQRKANKYDYEDAWDRDFATSNEYARGLYTSQRHPDYNDYDHNTVNGYGSFADWVKEISNNSITINPYPVPREGYSGIYAKGIVNDIIEYQGRKLIVPIKLDHPRSYYEPLDPADFLMVVRSAAILKLEEMNSSGEINFDFSTYQSDLNNITIFIFPGTKGIAMASGVPGNVIIFGEKPAPNSYVHNGEMGGLAFLSGITADAHEFGHCIGWMHTNAGPYCVMNPNGRMNGDCPPHPNIVFKLQKNWIDESHIRKIRTCTQVTDINPSINNGDCAVITVYGEPGFNNDWLNHSEYTVIENRRRVSFDRFIVGLNNIPVPPGFNGGCLIWKYSAHHGFTQDIHPNSSGITNLKLITANGFDQFTYSDSNQSKGNPAHFWGVAVNQAGTVYNNLIGTGSNSSFDLPTGISITDIEGSYNTPGDYLRFNVVYNFGEPTQYTAVLLGPAASIPVTLNGTYFHAGTPSRFINIMPGTVIDFPTNVLRMVGTHLEPYNIIANGTPQKPIIFQGCGYYHDTNKYVCSFNGIQLSNRGTASGFDSTIFRNCIIKNSSADAFILIAGNSAPENIPINLENNTFADAPGKFLISASNVGFFIQNIRNNVNSNIVIGTSAVKPFTVNGSLQIPAGSQLDVNLSSKLLFSENADFIVNGFINIAATPIQPVVFDKTPEAENWKGLFMDNGGGNLKECKFNNAVISIDNYYSKQICRIENCSFTNSRIYDIRLKMTSFNSVLISGCTFNGDVNKLASISGVDAGNLTIEFNKFNNELGKSIFFNNVANTQINENIFDGASGERSNTDGIFLYSSGCQITCNKISGYTNGIYMDGGSKPSLQNNEIWNNNIGIYLAGGSVPVMTSSYSGDESRVIAGYNQIYNNAQEEIFCTTTDPIAISYPLMQNGYNSVYDLINIGCLISHNGSTGIQAENNYWGSNPLPAQFCGTIDYQPFLTSQPPAAGCVTGNDKSGLVSKELLKNNIPKTFNLYQNYPNPFNPVTRIKYDVPKAAKITFTIYDLLGREVYTNCIYKEAGVYELEFDGSSLSSGIYFYRIESADYVNVKKMVLLK